MAGACSLLLASGCGSEERTTPETAAPETAAPETAAPETAAPELPPVPPPTKAFSAGDEIPEGFAREPEGRTGHDAFVGGVPVPWRCKVVSRTKTTFAARCLVHSGAARSYYSRIHKGFGRDMFGGVWEEEEQFAFFDRPYEKGMRIDISADREEALFGVQSNGIEVRIQNEPAGPPEPDPPPSSEMGVDDLFLGSFGQWRCGERTIFLGVRRIVIATRDADAVCNAVRLESAGDEQLRVKCASVTGDHEEVLPPGAASRYANPGFVLAVQRNGIRFDGTGCRRFAGRPR